MNGILLLLIGIVCCVVGYVVYGGWLSKQWGVDPNRKTPAYEYEDGVDYCPAKAPVLLGHHFASIAGAGPINGPIQAAYFGWLPVTLWILIGGIFIGAVQDYSALFISIRNKGKSIGEVLEVTLNHKCKMMFSVFVWLVMLLVDAAFGDIVAKTFNCEPGAASTANGSVAMASMLFIPLAIAFGFMVYRKHAPLLVSTVAGVAVLALAVVVGINFPLVFTGSTVWFWRVVVFVYCAVASVTPVWILLQPRDYLNSFLLYFMIAASVVGIFLANPTVGIPAFTSFKVGSNFLFPALFITVACGACSGFHSLIASGTTSKQLANEKDAQMIGYGGMLLECVLAIISLIAVGSLFTSETFAEAFAAKGATFYTIATSNGTTPAIVLASAVSEWFGGSSIIFTVISLAVSAFCLTSLDSCCRLGRFTLQEMFQPADGSKPKGIAKLMENMYFSTIFNIALAFLLVVAGYSKIWPLFGAANQMVSVPALMAAAVYLKKVGRNNKMFIPPMFFMAAASMVSMVLTFKTNIGILVAGATGADLFTNVLQCIIIVPMLILAVLLLIDGCKFLFGKKVEA
jgi:carbon starvation protein